MFFKRAAKLNSITFGVFSFFLALMVIFLPSENGPDPLMYVLFVYGVFLVLNIWLYVICSKHIKAETKIPGYIKWFIIFSMIVNFIVFITNLEGLANFVVELRSKDK